MKNMLCQRCKQLEATVSIRHVENPASDEHYCDQCASEIMHTPLAAHKFASLFSGDGVFRITFEDGDMFFLKDFSTVHPTIYGDADRWTSTVVEHLRLHPKSKHLMRAGSGLDFNEKDIAEIFDESRSKLLFSSKQVA